MKIIDDAINKSDKKVYLIGEVTESQIKNAENILGFEMTSEMKSYLKKYGAISVGHVEFYGLGVQKDSYMNIVFSSKEILNDDLLKGEYLVIESLGDVHYAIYNHSGVFEYTYGDKGIGEKINNNFGEYIRNRIKAANKM